jgi:hypothetical protein
MCWPSDSMVIPMYRSFLLKILACFCVTCLSLRPAQAIINRAASTSQADVHAALMRCAVGDTLQLPAGTNIWTGTEMLTNGIFVVGAGSNTTCICNNQPLSGGNQMPLFSLVPLNNNPVFIKDIYFKQTGGNTAAIGQWGANPLVPTKIRITSCTFEAFHFALMLRECFGVVDHCLFTNCFISSRCSGFYRTADLKQVAPPLWPWNSLNSLCFEDNVFVVTATTPYMYFGDTELPASYTVRNCTFNITRNSGDGYDGWDMHGNGGFPGGVNNVGVQIYGNTFDISGTTSAFKLSDIRGGVGSLVYSNLVKGCTAYNQCRTDPVGSLAPTNSYFWQNIDSSGRDIGANAGQGTAVNVNYFLSMPTNFAQLVYPHPLTQINWPPPPLNVRRVSN